MRIDHCSSFVMLERWKSNEKHFCEICKCWLAGNKITIQHHESAARHKAAVEAKIKDIGFKRREKEQEARDTKHALRAMELGAMQSYRKDLKMAPEIGMTYDVSKNAPTLNYGALRAGRLAIAKPAAPGNLVPSDMKAPMTYKEAEALHEYLHGPDQDKANSLGPAVHPILPEQIAPKDWAEARTPEGNVYYWHTSTGETMWTPPVEGYLTETEQAVIIASESVVSVGQPTYLNTVPKKKEKKRKKESTTSKDMPGQYFDPELGYMVGSSANQNFTSPSSAYEYTVQSYAPNSVDPEPTTNHVVDPQLSVLPYTEPRIKSDPKCESEEVVESTYTPSDPLLTPEEMAKRLADFKREKMYKKQKVDPYGSAWSSVESSDVKQPMVDLGLPKNSNQEVKPVVSSNRDHERFKFKEKTISIKMSKSSQPVAFNKRKAAQRRIRNREEVD